MKKGDFLIKPLLQDQLVPLHSGETRSSFVEGDEGLYRPTIWGKYHWTVDLLFDCFGFDQTSKADAKST